MTRVSPFVEVTKKPRRVLVLDDDFSDGMQGWSGLIAAGRNYYPTLHAGSRTGAHALCIDTRGGQAAVTATASKRLPAFIGKWYIDLWFAWNAKADAAGPEGNGLEEINFALDWQSGATTRKWFQFDYQHYDEGGSAVDPFFRISNGSANAFNTVTEIGAYELGYNQAYKYDYHHLVWSFVADGSRSRWDKVILDGITYDLSSYQCDQPQAEVEDFDNGANLLVQCQNRTTNSAADPFVLLDSIRVEIEEE